MSQEHRFRNHMAEAHNTATQERIPWGAEVVYIDDFLWGAGGLATIPNVSSEENGFGWTKLIVGNGPPTIGVVADAANGVMELALESTGQAQDAMIYHSDQRAINLKAGLQVEVRVKFSVLPTSGVAAVFGLAGDHNLDKDSITEHAWFRAQASAAILAETDDTTNNEDDKATGVTVLTTDWKIYRIDFSTLADVRFYIEGDAVALATTFDMSNLSTAEAVMQPYFSLDKASGGGVGTMQVDYFKSWWKREA